MTGFPSLRRLPRPQPSSGGAGRRPLRGRVTARPSHPFSGFGITSRGSKGSGHGEGPKNRKNIGSIGGRGGGGPATAKRHFRSSSSTSARRLAAAARPLLGHYSTSTPPLRDIFSATARQLLDRHSTAALPPLQRNSTEQNLMRNKIGLLHFEITVG